MIWQLMITHVFGFIADTRSHFRTVRQKCVCSMCWMVVCILHTIYRDTQTEEQRLSSSASDTCVWPACGHKAVFAEALV